jgi:hypothetical protein
MTTITMKEVAAFLLGEASLDGYWFGERHPISPFWWREHLRAALSAPATAPEPVAWINGHDLRLLGRQGRGALVWCDKEGNADTPLYLHPPATAPDDRHAQELLAQDITLQNMAERHAQELCAYELTVQNLLAERKPMTDDETLALFDRVKVRMLFTDAEAAPFASGVAAAEHFHGIGDKT